MIRSLGTFGTCARGWLQVTQESLSGSWIWEASIPDLPAIQQFGTKAGFTSHEEFNLSFVELTCAHSITFDDIWWFQSVPSFGARRFAHSFDHLFYVCFHLVFHFGLHGTVRKLCAWASVCALTLSWLLESQVEQSHAQFFWLVPGFLGFSECGWFHQKCRLRCFCKPFFPRAPELRVLPKQEKPTNPNAMHIKEPKNKSRNM